MAPEEPQQIDKFVKACFQIDADGFVQAFTDGSVTKRASLGVWFGPYHHLNYKQVIDDVYPHETPDINVAEMMAVHKAISIVKDNGGLKLAIHTDSKRIIEDINLILTNRQKGKKRKTYNKCPDTVDEIVTFHQTMNIRLVKVSSHQPNGACPGNDGADALCDEALNEIACGKKTSSIKQAINKLNTKIKKNKKKVKRLGQQFNAMKI